MSTQTLFERLSSIDVSKYVEKKNGLSYLSWAHAWKAFKSACPDATYKILGEESPIECIKGAIVWTEVTAAGETHRMWLPVMDYRNKAIEQPDAMDLNKAIMRCLVKNLAMFGLGLNIYAGEDLPTDEPAPKAAPKAAPKPKPAPKDELKAERHYQLFAQLSADNVKWMEIVWPFGGEEKGKTLSQMAAEGKVKKVGGLADYVKKLADTSEKKFALDYVIGQLNTAVEHAATGDNPREEKLPF